MNKKIGLPIALTILLLGITFVCASMISTSPASSNKITYDVEIQLVKGWNLVLGVPIGEAILSDSEIKSTNIKAIYYYSRSENKYLQYYPNSQEVENYISTAQQNSNEIIYFSQAPVWVYSDMAGILKYSRKDFPKFETGMNLPLSTGWNFVTMVPEMSSKTFNDLKGNCNAEKLYLYVPQLENVWQSMDIANGLFGTEDVGKGFLVKVTSDCLMSEFASASVLDSDINPPPIPQ